MLRPRNWASDNDSWAKSCFTRLVTSDLNVFLVKQKTPRRLACPAHVLAHDTTRAVGELQ